jgi:hypothetical protein
MKWEGFDDQVEKICMKIGYIRGFFFRADIRKVKLIGKEYVVIYLRL